MRYLGYLGCVFLGGLCLILLPPNVFSAEAAAPTITGVNPAVVIENTSPSPYLTITGVNWPNESYGLSAHFLNPYDGSRTALETVSYTPLDNKMVVQLPYWVKYQAGTYDLMVITRNGLIGTLKAAVQLTDELTSLPSEETTEPQDETEEAETTQPTRPETSMTTSGDGAPQITSYGPDIIGVPGTSPALILTGANWPNEMYGLQVYLIDPESWNTIPLTTLSYTPESGRMVVHIPALSHLGPKTYDLAVSTRSGLRTVIHNGLWVSG